MVLKDQRLLVGLENPVVLVALGDQEELADLEVQVVLEVLVDLEAQLPVALPVSIYFLFLNDCNCDY